jgi:general secretion pathway protein K
MRRGQRGVALLTAVVLVAIAAITATAIAFNSTMDARRGIAVFTVAQALRFAEGAEAMAAYTLREDLQQNRVDALNESWAMPYGPTEFDTGVLIEARLEDQQGRFNINNLVDGNGVADPIAREEFERLLALLGLDSRWAQLLTDWIDRDIEPGFPDGAEDSSYLGQSPPYRTPNMPVTSITELMALPGMTRAIYQRLQPYLAALPPGTTVNVCTAPGAVLDAMTPGRQEFSLDEPQLAKRRESGCFPTLPEFKATMNEEQFQRIANRVSDNSRYFRLRSWITIGTTRFTLYSLINRDAGGQIRPILRTFGTD